jgi:hypothetical protein
MPKMQAIRLDTANEMTPQYVNAIRAALAAGYAIGKEHAMDAPCRPCSQGACEDCRRLGFGCSCCGTLADHTDDE